MAVSPERSQGVVFPRPLPHPAVFTWGTWAGVCALAYWNYVLAAGAGVSVLLSIGFWTMAIVIVPLVVQRSRERGASVVAATIALLAYVLLMQDALR